MKNLKMRRNELIQWLFLFTILQLPAELPIDLLGISNFVMTPLEITLLTLIFVFCIDHLNGRRHHFDKIRFRNPGLWLVFWLVSLYISALLSSDLQEHGLKFCLRTTAIASLFLLTIRINQLRYFSRHFGYLQLLAALASLVAIMGFVEMSSNPWMEPFFRLFRSFPTMVDGSIRLTTTFSHANQTAAFLAMALPLLLGMSLSSKGLFRIGWLMATGITLWGLFGTFSRAGIIAGSLSAFCLLLLSMKNSQYRKTAILLLLVLSTIWIIKISTSPAFYYRFVKPSIPALDAVYEVPEKIIVQASETIKIPIEIKNQGYLTWRNKGLAPVYLSYHLYQANKQQLIRYENLRTQLIQPIASNEQTTIEAMLNVPRKEGVYSIEWDLVCEGFSWFSDLKILPSKTILEVTPNTNPSQHLKNPTNNIMPTYSPPHQWDPVNRTALWQIAVKIFKENPVTGVGPDTFRLRYGDYLSGDNWDPKLHTNNLYLELLANSGLAGLITWVGFLTVLAFPFLLKLKHNKPEFDPIAISLGMALLVFLIHGILDSFMEFYGIMGFFWIICGTIASRTNNSHQSETV